MNKEKEEMLERLRNVEKMENNIISINGQEDKIKIEDVKYLGTASIKLKDSEETKEINIYAVLEGKTIKYFSDDMCLGFETDGVGVMPSQEYEKEYEKDNPIKDIIKNLKEIEIEEKEKSKEEKNIKSLNELEEEKTEEYLKDNEKDNKKNQKEQHENDKENINNSKRISNTKGEIDLDMMVEGETLRKILGLSENDKTINPVSKDKLIELDPEGNYNNKEGFIVIDSSGNQRPLKDDILEPDRQEGNNSFDRDLNVEEDGSLSYESNLVSYKIKNRPNLYLSVSYDEGTSTRETKISNRSGREGDDEVEFTFLKREQDANLEENSDARRLRMERDGIGKSENILEKQNIHEKAGCENDRVENIDNNENNDINHVHPDDKIEGTDITWQEFANRCGYREKDGVEKVHKIFVDYAKEHKDMKNEDIINNIEDDMIDDGPGGNRNR